MSAWRDPASEEIALLLERRTGLAFGESRVPDAEAGIGRAMTKAGVESGADYLRLLEADARVFDDLVSEMVVSETYFFRDPSHFEFIRREILPQHFAREPNFRAWSAGCASGEEAYSLAILLDQEGLLSSSQILATDISRAALAKAKRARYAPWSLRGVPSSIVDRYFSRTGNAYDLDPKIRARVQFDHLNLALDSYPSLVNGTFRLNLILCRNVLIYLDRDSVHAVGRRLATCLAPDGWLITGPSDPLLAEEPLLQVVVTDQGVFHRRKAAPEPKVRARPRRSSRPTAIPPSPPPVAVEAPVLPQRPRDGWAEARAAFGRGDYQSASELARELPGPEARALFIRASANAGRTAEAERAATEAVARHPLDCELHVLQAALRVDLARFEEAAEAARRAIYLDRSSVIAHFLLGVVSVRMGRRDDARRAFRNARDLCSKLDPESVVPLSDGQTASRLLEAATSQLELLEKGGTS